MRVIIPRFKIDAIDDWLFKYGLFERKTLFGFVYWKCMSKSDSVDNLERQVEDRRKLPRYFD